MNRNRVLMLAPLLALALVSCDSQAGLPREAATVTELSGTAGSVASKQLSAGFVNPLGEYVSVGTVTAGNQGEFTLSLPGTLEAGQLVEANEYFACTNLPAAQVQMVGQLDVAGEGMLLLVPEQPAEATEPETTIVFLYSDRDLVIDSTCQPATAQSLTPQGNTNLTLNLFLIAGWNAIHLTETATGGDTSTLFATHPVLTNYIWYYLAYSAL